MLQPLILSTWSFGQRSNAAGWQVLARGGSSLDAVEAVGRFAESDLTNPTVGIGGLPDALGRVSLDASIMLSPSKCGAVANIQRFGHPVSIARVVMEKTPHVLLTGAEADEFAAEHGFEPEELLTPDSKARWEKWRRDNPDGRGSGPIRNIEESSMGLKGRDAAHLHTARNTMHDTIGVLSIDASGVLAGCCTTSGMPFKVPGRVGDSPIIGHGLYVDPQHGAATATGHGELVMGLCGSFLAVEAMRRGASPLDAATEMLERVMKSYDLSAEDQLGVIALNAKGEWSGASLRDGFSIAVKSATRDELVDSPRVMMKD